MEQQLITAGHTRIGWIGTGVMGLAMCARVQAAGFHVTIYARTPSKISALCNSGAASVESPMAVGERCDVVFTMLSNPSDVRQVVLGTDGVLSALTPGGILVDMTSSQPSLAKEIFEQATAKGCDSVDAPVSGGDIGAQNGTLAILAGGRQETVAKLEPLFRRMGSATYLGPAGSGQSCKIANQITVAANLGGLSEGLVFARKAGLDVRKYLAAIGGGAAGSKAIELFGERMIDRDFAPGGFADYMVKDLGMALEEGERAAVALPGSALHQKLYLSMTANGDGRLGSQGYITAIERLNNLQ
ncbi:hypothetical protein SUGI_0987930 [Cryptomeria japonica]|uniref:probable 3-hydroxyisobutyrate dehydrogenase-like 1, mitochondrial n=1 Tax=Cryptomeria japonica TaxID=3369 RepID=UPI002414AC18|nr:probable 3-hydroxyisobutyrate dehydrogenase-like 1, mitochondrial [Cryptomeria japonica]GLJ46828.1 hypothetical protein SUGI_0987930 [Cryptomeria japonica]